MISIANEIITNKLIEISKNKDLLNIPSIHNNIVNKDTVKFILFFILL